MNFIRIYGMRNYLTTAKVNRLNRMTIIWTVIKSKDESEEITELQDEIVELWFDIMHKESRISEHDDEIADVWYTIMTGGVA